MTLDDRCRRAVLVLGGACAGIGLVAVPVSWGAGFSASDSRVLGWPQHELAVLRFNVLGALVTLGLGTLAAVGARSKRRVLVNAAAAGFSVVALQALLQTSRSTNWLGATGSNLGLALGMAAGLAALSWAWSAAVPASPISERRR